jgi:hypothetical protein
MKQTIFAIFCLTVCGAFNACSQSPDGSNPTDPNAPRLADELHGSWKADTSINAFSESVDVTLNMTISTNHTFSETTTGSVPGNPIKGPLSTESGTWVADSVTNAVVLRPSNCLVAETAQTTLLPGESVNLPFKLSPAGLTANTLTATPCPDSVVITNHPVNDTLHLTMAVIIPMQDNSIWTLRFKKQP